MFNDDAEKLLGISAEELNALNTTNPAEYEKVFKNPLFKEYIFTLRVKVIVWNGFDCRWNRMEEWNPVYDAVSNVLFL